MKNEPTVTPPPENNLSAAERESVEMHFRGGKKLSIDYVNAYAAQHAYAAMGENFLAQLEPIRSYQEYFEQNYSHLYDYTMELSDLDAIVALNKLVADFNSDLERIKKEGDIAAANNFLQNIHKLVYSKK